MYKRQILDTNYRGPKLTPQTIVTPENTPVTQCAPIEFESDGGILNATMCGAPTKGTITNITISEDQDRLCYTFTPNPGQTGIDEVCFEVCHGAICDQKIFPIYIIPSVPTNTPVYNPDNNVTYVNVPVPGNVKTNDKDVKPGTTYGTPVPVAGNPANCVPTMTPASGNTTGAYTFTCATPGVYKFTVPVCEASPSTTCTNVPLVITVLDNTTPANNGPVANNDYGTTPQNTPVTLPTLVNDKPGNSTTNLVPGSVTVTTSPTNGTATVNPTTGDITYTPNPGFTGTDVLTYQVCDNASPAKCATAQQVITVRPTGSPNTTEAVDDYYSTPKDTPVSGNVKTNDRDPEGNTQTVTPQNTTSPGKGTLVLNNDGTFTFTPVTGYTGPVSFPYTTCDNGTPQACANATLYITVAEAVCIPDLNPAITVLPNNGISGQRDMVVLLDIKEILGCATTAGQEVRVSVAKVSDFSFNWAPYATATAIPVANVTGLENSRWTFSETTTAWVWVYNAGVINANEISNIGFMGIWNAGASSGKLNFTVTIRNGSGGETNTLNNVDYETVTYDVAP